MNINMKSSLILSLQQIFDKKMLKILILHSFEQIITDAPF